MRTKSILTEARQIERAVTLIQLGARLQVLESETDLSYERLLRLYKEVAGHSPSKGQLPFSTDWFMTWQPNIHASLFMNIHEYLNKVSELDEIDVVIKAYGLYLEQTKSQGLEPLLSVTRAWRLVKFMDNGMLSLTKCSKCGGHYVSHPHEIAKHYVCGLCCPPGPCRKGPFCRRPSAALTHEDLALAGRDGLDAGFGGLRTPSAPRQPLVGLREAPAFSCARCLRCGQARDGARGWSWPDSRCYGSCGS